jgi:hypothetical protein
MHLGLECGFLITITRLILQYFSWCAPEESVFSSSSHKKIKAYDEELFTVLYYEFGVFFSSAAALKLFWFAVIGRDGRELLFLKALRAAEQVPQPATPLCLRLNYICCSERASAFHGYCTRLFSRMHWGRSF